MGKFKGKTLYICESKQWLKRYRKVRMISIERESDNACVIICYKPDNVVVEGGKKVFEIDNVTEKAIEKFVKPLIRYNCYSIDGLEIRGTIYKEIRRTISGFSRRRRMSDSPVMLRLLSEIKDAIKRFDAKQQQN